MELAPGTVVERYEIVRQIGSGGSAHVHLALHQSLDSRHALKAIDVHDADAVAAVLEEGRIQARVSHPNVVMISDVVMMPGAVGLVMEHVEGRALSDVIGRGRPLRRGDVSRIFRHVAAGLTAAHRAGILHLDVKPGNILLDTRGGEVVARITDFGIARALARETADTRVGAGTAGYMAPEQVEPDNVIDTRTDVFGLACVLYEMCCGYSPFLRDRRPDTLRATLHGLHIPLQDRDPLLPDSLCAAVEQALAVDPAQRFATVSQFALACEDGFARIVEPPSPGTLVTVPIAALNGGNAMPQASRPNRIVPAPPPRLNTPTPPPPRRSWAPVLAVASVLLSPVVVSVGARQHILGLEEAFADAALALDTPWRASGPATMLVAHAESQTPLKDAVAAMTASSSPASRLTAARQLHGALEREALRQAVDANDADARARARATEADLATATRLLDLASTAALDHDLAERSVLGVLAAPAQAVLGERPPIGLGSPLLGAFTASEPRVAKKGR